MCRDGSWQLVGMGCTGKWLAEGTGMNPSGQFFAMDEVGDKKGGENTKQNTNIPASSNGVAKQVR